MIDLDLTKTFLILQKIRFDYGSDEKIMERRRMETVVGPHLAGGEKPRGSTSSIVTREEGSTE